MRIDKDGRLLTYGTLGAGNLPLSGNAANAAIQIRCDNKYKGIAFGQGAVNGTIGLGGAASSTALVYTANSNPANLGGGDIVVHEWWAGNSGGGGPAKLLTLSTTGHLLPGSDNAQNLGASGTRWANIYTDLQLSNEGKQNEVDGTWGNYTIQEGEDDLFLINRRNGKRYKFNLTEMP